MLVDAHTHLLAPEFANRLDIVLNRARNGRVGLLLCNATQRYQWPALATEADHDPGIYPFFGLHPWFVGQEGQEGWEDELAHCLSRHGGGVGEIGLDRACPVEVALQERFFLDQLDLAIQYQRPVTLHCVRHWGRLLDLLKDRGTRLPQVLVHSYGGSLESMHRLLDLGCWFSFSMRLMAPGAVRLQDVFARVPLDRLLLETDAPMVMPRGLELQAPGGDGLVEPSMIGLLYRFAADHRGIDCQAFEGQLEHNATVFTNREAAG